MGNQLKLRYTEPMLQPQIILGADHNGYRLKEHIARWLTSRGFPTVDAGAKNLDPRDHYPIFAKAVASAVKDGHGLGVLICGSGHGMVIAANRVRGVRAALCTTPFSAAMARHDDHANVLVIAAWETNFARAKGIMNRFLTTKPSTAARHLRRLAMLERIR